MNLHLVRDKAILALFFLFPIFSVTVNSVGSVIYILLFLLAMVYGWKGWTELSRFEKKVLLSFAAFVVLSLLSIINADNWYETSKSFEQYLRILFIIPIYLMIKRSDIELGKLFLLGIVVGGFFIGLVAIYQVHVLGMPHSNGGYHKIVFGDTAILLAAILWGAAIALDLKRWQLVVCLVGSAFALYASVLSQTRGAWLFIPVVIILWLWMFRRRLSARAWVSIAIVLVACMGALLVWQPAKMTKPLSAGVENLKTYQENPSAITSWGIRLNLWKDSIEILKRHPFIGTGVGDLSMDRQQLWEEGIANKVYLEGNQAHSIYFQALATRGLIGFFALIICLFILPLMYFYHVWNSAEAPWLRFYSLSGVTVIFAFAVFGLSEGWLTRNPFVNAYAMYVLAFMLSLSYQKNKLISVS